MFKTEDLTSTSVSFSVNSIISVSFSHHLQANSQQQFRILFQHGTRSKRLFENVLDSIKKTSIPRSKLWCGKTFWILGSIEGFQKTGLR